MGMQPTEFWNSSLKELTISYEGFKESKDAEQELEWLRFRKLYTLHYNLNAKKGNTIKEQEVIRLKLDDLSGEIVQKYDKKYIKEMRQSALELDKKWK